MIRFFERHRKAIFLAVVAVFLVGIFVGLGSYLFTSADLSNSVARVGKEKIPYSRYQIQLQGVLKRLEAQGTELDEDTRKRVRQEVLRDMVVEELLYQRSVALGLEVTDLELRSEIQSTPAFQRDGNFDQGLYFQTVFYQFHMTPEKYEAWRRRSLASLKFRQLIFNSVKLTADDVRDLYRLRKGGLKDFEKEKVEFSRQVSREMALHTINFYLGQVSRETEVEMNPNLVG